MHTPHLHALHMQCCCRGSKSSSCLWALRMVCFQVSGTANTGAGAKRREERHPITKDSKAKRERRSKASVLAGPHPPGIDVENDLERPWGKVARSMQVQLGCAPPCAPPPQWS